MKGAPARIIGIILIITALIGLIFSIVGIVYLWQVKTALTNELVADVGLVSDTLTTTSDGLEVTLDSVSTTRDSIVALQVTLSETAKTIEATTPLVNTLVGLLENDIPDTISSAKVSLAAAEESAKVIDSMLNALKSIPLLGNNIYNPPVPLNEALSQLSQSLDPLPASIETMKESLTTSTENISTVQLEIQLMASDLADIDTSLENAQMVVTQYQDQVETLNQRIEGLQKNLPRRINTVFVFLTFLLIWVGVAQLGFITQALELLNR